MLHVCELFHVATYNIVISIYWEWGGGVYQLCKSIMCVHVYQLELSGARKSTGVLLYSCSLVIQLDALTVLAIVSRV